MRTEGKEGGKTTFGDNSKGSKSKKIHPTGRVLENSKGVSEKAKDFVG